MAITRVYIVSAFRLMVTMNTTLESVCEIVKEDALLTHSLMEKGPAGGCDTFSSTQSIPLIL